MAFNNSSRLAVVIPAYKPSDGLIGLVQSLADKHFPAIIVVNDGSGPAFDATFSAVAEIPGVRLLRHAVNLGKGAALKTAFNYVLCEMPDAVGVVTADADGQHHPDDIASVVQRLIERPECLIMGSRQFGKDVPLRSRFGNIATRGIMHALLGRKLTDTQTGLRGIPMSLLPQLMRLESTGYEFELEMLMAAHHLQMTVVEEPIRTIYEPGNKSSHFNPVVDSMKIYFVLLRFGSVSLMTAVIDNLVFILMRRRGMDVLPAQVLGRAIALVFNYSMVRSSVFYSRQEHRAVLPKYLALVVASGTASYAGIRALSSNFGIDPIPAKLFVETLLFFVNFAVQRLFIFKPATQETAVEPAERGNLIFGPIAGLLFLALVGLEWQGLRTSDLFSQYIWHPVGLRRFEYYTGAFLAFSVPLLVVAPWSFTGFLTSLLLVLTTLAIGPQAVLGTAFFLLSACALGSKLIGAKDDAIEDHLLAALLGTGIYIFLMTVLARQPVHYWWTWTCLLGLPLLADFRGVGRRFRSWLGLVRSATLPSIAERAAFAATVFFLVAHWFTALKPESSADGLAMHLAVPLDIAANHRMTFEPSRWLWSVMPMGADWAYSIVNLLGGEYAAHLLVWCMLAAIVALSYSMLRRLVSSAAAWLLVALFLSTPIVNFVTSSLFVENVLAAVILGMITGLWRFSETGERKYLYLAMALGGTAMTVKIGALAFVALGLIYASVEIARNWKRLGAHPWVACVVASVLLFALGAPTYVIAYRKTGNPVFPFLNKKYPSPMLEPGAEFIDNRYRQPLKLRTLYDMTFQSGDFYEGQRGSFGFQYLIIVPMTVLGLLVVRRRIAVMAALIGVGAAILILRSEPNLRYAYASIPVIAVGFAGLLSWLAARQLVLYRALILFLAGCAVLNAWFLPSSSYYHKDFFMRQPFSRIAREQALPEAAPVRDVIAYFNRAHAGAGVLFTHDSYVAGTIGNVYQNHWHQWMNRQRIHNIGSAPEMLDLMKTWGVQYFILEKPVPGERLKPAALAKLVEACAIPEYERGSTYLARLDPACNPAAPTPPAEPIIVARRGTYDDFDPAIVLRGDWDRDTSFTPPWQSTISYTDIPGAEIAFAFEGAALRWLYTNAPNRGIAAVTIDGVNKEPVDLFSQDIAWQAQTRYCCFGPGKHVIVIRVTGRKHEQSTGRFVDLDAFVVE